MMIQEGRSVRGEGMRAPSTDSMLKLSLGLAMFAVLASIAVYAETVTVEIGGQSYEIQYTADGAAVTGVTPDLETISLILDVDVPGDEGTIDFTFDRQFFDSVCGGLDDEFIALVDGEFLEFEESKSDQSRTLSMSVLAGTGEIELIGSRLAGAELLCKEDADAARDPPADEPPVDVPPADEPPADSVPDVMKKDPTQCGPGTILQDGQCILDMTCGPGTILSGNQCILDRSAAPAAPSTIKSLGKDLGVGFFAAFAAAGIVGIVLGLVARGSRSS